MTYLVLVLRLDYLLNLWPNPQEKDVFELEKKIGCGQIEEVILQAENELRLARNMLEWKAWEPLKAPAPQNQWKWPM